jgi:putative hydrolase of the HAD superfamily
MSHPASPFQVVLFDFGSTLIYSKDPWPPIYARADRALAEALHAAGIPIDPRAFSKDFGSFLDIYYSQRGTSTLEHTATSSLKELLTRHGFPNTPVTVLRDALDALYAVTQQNWYREDDALPTLMALQQAGYRLGMVSNTSDDENVQQLLDRWELRPFFETVVTSAGCGIRKPDPRIFQLALDHFGVPPARTVMVGDTPEADILGANRLGIFSVWITRRVPVDDPPIAAPDLTVASLREIPPALSALS